MIENQNATLLRLKDADYPEYLMPYYDYLLEHLGIDRTNIPEQISRQYGYNGCRLPEFSWTFNEIIYCSLGGQSSYYEMRRFNHQSAANTNDCKELVRLVILYGGEQEQCEK